MSFTGGCFGGANGERGFVNYFDAVCEGIGRLYIIKGGSGCGKSTLMRAAAAEAEKRGETAELIYCASDPASLDGVLFRERGVGILDGTAPHERAPRYTGAVDCIVDLGEYLNVKRLRERAPELVELTDRKSALYERAYGLLSAAGEIRRQISLLTEEALLWNKAFAAARRIAAKHAGGGEGGVSLRPRTAFCAAGRAEAEDYGCSAVYAVHDPYDAAYCFYRALLAACLEYGIPVTLSPDETSPQRIEALRLDTDGVLFKTGETEDAAGTVNLERFVDREALKRTRARRRFLEKARASLTEAAREALAEARALHCAIEDIYVPAMNFDRVDRRKNALIKEIFA